MLLLQDACRLTIHRWEANSFPYKTKSMRSSVRELAHAGVAMPVDGRHFVSRDVHREWTATPDPDFSFFKRNGIMTWRQGNSETSCVISREFGGLAFFVGGN